MKIFKLFITFVMVFQLVFIGMPLGLKNAYAWRPGEFLQDVIENATENSTGELPDSHATADIGDTSAEIGVGVELELDSDTGGNIGVMENSEDTEETEETEIPQYGMFLLRISEQERDEIDEVTSSGNIREIKDYFMSLIGSLKNVLRLDGKIFIHPDGFVEEQNLLFLAYVMDRDLTLDYDNISVDARISYGNTDSKWEFGKDGENGLMENITSIELPTLGIYIHCGFISFEAINMAFRPEDDEEGIFPEPDKLIKGELDVICDIEVEGEEEPITLRQKRFFEVDKKITIRKNENGRFNLDDNKRLISTRVYDIQKKASSDVLLDNLNWGLLLVRPGSESGLRFNYWEVFVKEVKEKLYINLLIRNRPEEDVPDGIPEPTLEDIIRELCIALGLEEMQPVEFLVALFFDKAKVNVVIRFIMQAVGDVLGVGIHAEIEEYIIKYIFNMIGYYKEQGVTDIEPFIGFDNKMLGYLDYLEGSEIELPQMVKDLVGELRGVLVKDALFVSENIHLPKNILGPDRESEREDLIRKLEVLENVLLEAGQDTTMGDILISFLNSEDLKNLVIGRILEKHLVKVAVLFRIIKRAGNVLEKYITLPWWFEDICETDSVEEFLGVIWEVYSSISGNPVLGMLPDAIPFLQYIIRGIIVREGYWEELNNWDELLSSIISLLVYEDEDGYTKGIIPVLRDVLALSEDEPLPTNGILEFDHGDNVYAIYVGQSEITSYICHNTVMLTAQLTKYRLQGIPGDMIAEYRDDEIKRIILGVCEKADIHLEVSDDMDYHDVIGILISDMKYLNKLRLVLFPFFRCLYTSVSVTGDRPSDSVVLCDENDVPRDSFPVGGKVKIKVDPEEGREEDSLNYVVFNDKDFDGRLGIDEPLTIGLLNREGPLYKGEIHLVDSRAGNMENIGGCLPVYPDDKIEVLVIDMLDINWEDIVDIDKIKSNLREFIKEVVPKLIAGIDLHCATASARVFKRRAEKRNKSRNKRSGRYGNKKKSANSKERARTGGGKAKGKSRGPRVFRRR